MASWNTILYGNGKSHLDEHILVRQAGVVFSIGGRGGGEEVAAYKGESGRNGYSRGREHPDYWESHDEDKSVLWLHSVHHHQSR